MKKFCTRCGRQFESVGREVICPTCKEQAAEDAKRAAVLKAKTKSWTGESVPVRISGRASTVIRKYGAANNMTFAESLDDLLKSTDYFKSAGKAWDDVEPYRSRRRDKNTTEGASTTKNKQDAQAAGKPQEVKTAAKTSTSKTSTAKKAVKTSTSKAAGKGGKA